MVNSACDGALRSNFWAHRRRGLHEATLQGTGGRYCVRACGSSAYGPPDVDVTIRTPAVRFDIASAARLLGSAPITLSNGTVRATVLLQAGALSFSGQSVVQNSE